MTRLTSALARVLGGAPAKRDGHVEDLRERLHALHTRVEQLQQRTERLLERERERVYERASLVAMPRARLLAASIALEGTPSERVQVGRVRVGEPVARPFSRWVGLTRCVSTVPDVRELWTRLLAFEAECGDDALRGVPCTILDVPGAVASVVDGTLRITPRLASRPRTDVIAIPRCVYDAAVRKVGNFGHWMLDWAPQVVALWKLAPDATVLMPHASKWFHTATLAHMGLDPRQMVPWDGSPVECGRLLAFEGDGRTGGGRPLSPLMEVRRLLEPAAV
ncbi:MAG: DUF563 domain-containing protein, partial [Acidobacteria bacterium]|nr:DUF563 domain-containing protein [Acidobacteriota bacterium]